MDHGQFAYGPCESVGPKEAHDMHTEPAAGATAHHPLTALLRHEAAPGLLLLAAASVAVVLANSPLDWLYGAFLDTPVAVQVGALSLHKPLLLWINDGLMALFFFRVGLEIKHELLDGRLSDPRQAALPAIAALGGMVVPAAIYALVNAGNPAALRGWAIPTATDIAFALGALSLLGNRVPAALKVFLLALAILDDVGSILIIALFYTADLAPLSLALAALCAAGLVLLNRGGVTRIAPYVLIGIAMWVCVLKSGVHATLAGVFTALTIPAAAADPAEPSPLRRLEHALEPWIAFGIMPLFAFANAGVSLAGVTLSSLLAPVPLGIALGLFAGKQIGVFGASWLAVRAGLCRLPAGVGWRHIHGASSLAGIGFTMSLFIGSLAFPSAADTASVRIGVLAGSLVSAAAGYLMLRRTLKSPLSARGE